jgi:hypothetical protein
MFKAIADGFNWLFSLLATLFSKLMNGLMWLLQPLFDLIGIVFDFIIWTGIVLAKIVVLVFTIAKMLIGLIAGLFKTIVGFGYSGSVTNLPGSYQSVYTHIRPTLNTLQMDKLAYVILFGIWIFTAFAAMKIIGNMRGGGGD